MAVAIIDSRRKRVNVESMVAFDGLTQNATVTNPNLNAGVQAISFFVNVNSSLSISKGAWSFTEAGLPLNRKVHVVIQGGGRLFINSIDTAAATNFPANVDPLVLAGASLVNHFAAFNRTLTPAEISYIHAQGGLLPASTHAVCVAHYPCTHREGNILFDVVEQYNYAKSTAQVPYHATLQNFTPEQHSGSAQIAWKDFYTKKQNNPFCYNFLQPTITSKYFNYGNASASFQSQSFTCYYRFNSFSTIGQVSNNYVVANRNTGAIWHFAVIITPNGVGDTLGKISLKIGNASIGSVSNITFQNRWFKIAVTWNYATNQAILILGDDREILIQSTVDTTALIANKDLAWESFRLGNANNTSNWNLLADEFIIANKAVSLSQLQEIYRDRNYTSLVGNIYSHIIFSGGTNTISEQIGGRTFTVEEGMYLEKSSLLPPLRNALKFNGSTQYASFPNTGISNEKGYTIFGAFTLDSDRNFKGTPFGDRFWNARSEGDILSAYFIMRGLDTDRVQISMKNTSLSGFNITSIAGSMNRKDQINAIWFTLHQNKVFIYVNGKFNYSGNISYMPDFTQYGSNIILGMDDYVDANRVLNGSIPQAGIAKGVATPKQVHEMWNNSLLMQPKKSWTNLDWQLLLDFNQIIDNAGTYELENLGSAGGNATLSGYTAANVDPLDPSYALTDINSLR